MVSNILVIDNDALAHQQFRRLADQARELHVIFASTGSEGLGMALESEPDLIVLSAQISDMDWHDLLYAVRAESRDIPVILTSSRDSTREAVEAFRAGAIDYLRKPLELATMSEAMERAWHKVKLLEERDRLAQQLTETTEILQRQQQELNAVHVVGRLTTSVLDLDVVLDRLSEIAIHLTNAQESMLFLRDEEHDELYLRAGKNLGPALNEGFKVTVDGDAAGRAIRTARPVLVTGEGTRLAPGGPSEALLYVPLQAPERVIGLLTVSTQRPEDAFSQRDIVLLSTLADYAAIAIQNARLFESIAQSKLLMDSVFSSIGSGVLTVDSEKCISLINRAAREILQAPDVAAGASLADACPAIESKLGGLIEATEQQEESTGPLEVDLPLSSGHIVNLRMTLSPLRCGTGSTEGATLVFEDITRERKLESRFRLFQRYVSPTVVERLPDDPQELKLGGVRQDIACLFADLRGFVDFSTRLPPESLMETLNQYLGLAAEAVLAEEGTLDKFVGDAVVAFFNAPLTQEDYTLRAVRAAVKIRDTTMQLHARLEPDRQLRYGIGVSVGEAIVGNIGTPQRLDYTAIGPSVNIASRLQAAAEPGQILITPEIYQRTRGHITARPLTLQGVTGLDDPFDAYELLDLS